MKVWIEQGKDNIPQSVNIAYAMHGFMERGAEIEYFTREQLIMGDLPIQHDTPVVGTISSVKKAWQQLSVKVPECMDYPDCLKPHLRRDMTQTTMNEAVIQLQETNFTPPYFLKPVNAQKAFTGMVVGSIQDLIHLGRGEQEMLVWKSEVIEFQSEWRTFILNNEILDIRPYRGNSFIAPTESTVVRMMQAFEKDAPVAYTLDVGTTEDGYTSLVEVNDSFAFGHYGLISNKYVQMIAARWFQVTGAKLPLGWI